MPSHSIHDISRYLQQIGNAGFVNKTLFLAIGEVLRKSTKARFSKQQAPDGSPWQPLSPQYAAYKRKRGYGKKILKMRGHLRRIPTVQATDASVSIGSNRIYAAMHQYGGRTRFGQIPARPYLGISDEDEKAIMGTLRDAFEAMQP